MEQHETYFYGYYENPGAILLKMLNRTDACLFSADYKKITYIFQWECGNHWCYFVCNLHYKKECIIPIVKWLSYPSSGKVTLVCDSSLENTQNKL